MGAQERIAVLGTGVMGAPIARNLLAAGFPVTVWNRTRARAEALVASDPELREPENALLGDLLRRSFGAEALEPIPA